MLKKNEDGEWAMPRGLSFHDMACEILDAVRDQDWTDVPGWEEGQLRQDFTAVKRYVKVTHGNACKTKMSKVRRRVHGLRLHRRPVSSVRARVLPF